MNKFNKGKKIGILTASLASVALVGVGFSTWIIGNQVTETNGDVEIQADDVKYKSLKIEITFTKGIKLAEASASGEQLGISSDDKAAGNLTATADIKFTIGKDFGIDDFTFSKLQFEVIAKATAGNGYVDNTVAESNVFTRTDGNKTGLTYFTIPDDYEFRTKPEFTKAVDDASNTNRKTLTLENQKIEFHWGSLFGNTGDVKDQSPVTYYNAQATSLSDDEAKDEYFDKAYKELSAMKGIYSNGAKIRLKAKLAA